MITKTQTLNDSNLAILEALHKEAEQAADKLNLNTEQQRIFDKSVELLVTGRCDDS